MIRWIIVSTIITPLVLFNVTIASGPTITGSMEDAIVESERSKQDALVVFGASWCPSCNVLKKDIENNPSVINDLVYCYVDIDDRNDLAKEYKVKSIPDCIVFRKNIEIKRRVGYKDLISFKKWLRQ